MVMFTIAYKRYLKQNSARFQKWNTIRIQSRIQRKIKTEIDQWCSNNFAKKSFELLNCVNVNDEMELNQTERILWNDWCWCVCFKWWSATQYFLNGRCKAFLVVLTGNREIHLISFKKKAEKRKHLFSHTSAFRFQTEYEINLISMRRILCCVCLNVSITAIYVVSASTLAGVCTNYLPFSVFVVHSCFRSSHPFTDTFYLSLYW